MKKGNKSKIDLDTSSPNLKKLIVSFGNLSPLDLLYKFIDTLFIDKISKSSKNQYRHFSFSILFTDI